MRTTELPQEVRALEARLRREIGSDVRFTDGKDQRFSFSGTNCSMAAALPYATTTMQSGDFMTLVPFATGMAARRRRSQSP